MPANRKSARRCSATYGQLLLLAGIATAIVVATPMTLCAQSPGKTDVEITIPNMHCESCAKKIRSHLFTIKGVAKVTTYVAENRVVVVPSAGKTLSALEIWDKLEKAKFTPDKIVTPTAEYTEKPPGSTGALEISR